MQGKAQRVQGLKVVDRYTVQIVLEEPLAPFLAVLGVAHAAVVPQDEVEKLGERFGRAPVGTGPFKFVRWVPNQEIVLEAHDHYHDGRPFLDAIVFKIVDGRKWEERFAEFLQGHLEETIIPSEKTDEVHTDPQYQQYQLIRKPTLSLLYIGFNTQFKPFDDRRVRQAFNYAVNTEAIVREITKRAVSRRPGPCPRGCPGMIPSCRGTPMIPRRPSGCWPKRGIRVAPVSRLCSSGRPPRLKAPRQSWQPINDIWLRWGCRWRSALLQIGRLTKRCWSRGNSPCSAWRGMRISPTRIICSPPCSTPPVRPIARSTAIPWWISCWSRPARNVLCAADRTLPRGGAPRHGRCPMDYPVLLCL